MSLPSRVIVQVSYPNSGNEGFKTMAFPLNLSVVEARNMSTTKIGIPADEKSKYALYLPEEDIWLREDDAIEKYKLKDRSKLECKLRPNEMQVFCEEESKLLPVDLSKNIGNLTNSLAEKFGEKGSDCILILETSDAKTTTLETQKTLSEYQPPSNAKLILKKKNKMGNIFRRSESPKTGGKQIFGAPLASVCDDRYGGIPAIVGKTIEYIEAEGLKIEGILRISGNQNEIQTLKKSFDSGADVNIRTCSSPHVATGLLKLYLRELPDPLFTFTLYDSIIGIYNSVKNLESRILYYKVVIDTLPKEHYLLLVNLLPFLVSVVKFEEFNKMAIHNVATVFGPNLLRSADESPAIIIQDTAATNGVVCDMIKNYDYLLANIEHDFISYGKALYGYEKKSESELSFGAGDFVFVVKESEGGWWEGEINGNYGFFPTNYFQILGPLTNVVHNVEIPKVVDDVPPPKQYQPEPVKEEPKPVPVQKPAEKPVPVQKPVEKPVTVQKPVQISSVVAAQIAEKASQSSSQAASQPSLASQASSQSSSSQSSSSQARGESGGQARGESGALSKKQFLQEIDDIKKHLQKEAAMTMELETNLMSLQSQLNQLSSRVKENSSPNNTKTSDADLNTYFNQLHSDYQSMQYDMEELSTRSNTLESGVSNLSNLITTSKTDIEELKDEKISLKRDFKILAFKVDKLQEFQISKLASNPNLSNNNNNNNNKSGEDEIHIEESFKAPTTRRVIPLKQSTPTVHPPQMNNNNNNEPLDPSKPSPRPPPKPKLP